jgi:hypothetical protein
MFFALQLLRNPAIEYFQNQIIITSFFDFSRQGVREK